MDSRYVQQFKKGSLEMILLCLIAKKETYGYEIITQLNDYGAAVLGYAKREPCIHIVPSSGCRTDSVQDCSGSIQRRLKKVLFHNRKGEGYTERAVVFWQRYKICVDGFIGEDDFFNSSAG